MQVEVCNLANTLGVCITTSKLHAVAYSLFMTFLNSQSLGTARRSRYAHAQCVCRVKTSSLMARAEKKPKF